jgi:hypothetical protein
MGACAVFLGGLFLVFSFFCFFFVFRAFLIDFRGEGKKKTLLSPFLPLHASSLSSLVARATTRFLFSQRRFFSATKGRHYTKSLPEHKPTDIYKNTMAFAALSTVRVVASVSRRRRRRRFFSLGFFVLSLSLSRARMREPSSELITDTFSIHFEY